MKNTILVLISILMVVFGLMAIISSGYEYEAEKLFYRAKKANRAILARPGTAMPKALAYVEGNLRKIIERYPRSKLSKEAQLSLAEFYLNNRSYTQALNSLYDIIKMYPEDKLTLSRAHFLRGNVFEQQNQWDKALREYKVVRDKYTDSPIALRVPLYIADHYREQKDYAQADKAYNEAVRFYKKLERRNRGEASGYAAASLLIRSYLELEQYEQAGETVEETIHLYPKLLPLAQQLDNIDLIFLKKLNKSDKAIELYKTMKVRTRNPQLIAILDGKIKALEAQK